MSTEQTSRLSRYENRAWRIAFGEDAAAAALEDVNDDGWYDIGLPHSFATPADLSTSFHVGHATYRHALEIDPSWLDRRLTLEFGAVFQHARVWLNGALVGHHRGGYTAFHVDITDAARPGRNLLAVQVDNEWDPELAPRAGEHAFNGGIYRDVKLHVTGHLHVDWWGTAITTEALSRERATIRVATALRNDSDEAARAEVRHRISLSGVDLGELRSFAEVPAAGSSSVTHTIEVADPEAWHPDRPVLHQLETQILLDGNIVDTTVEEFGIRTIEFTADRGFFLNGEHLWIDGANVHQDHAGWGDGVTHAAIGRDVALIKATGMNFIRGSHYPHHEHFATECDRQGMLFWSESPFWGIGGESREGFWTASAYPTDPEHEAAFESSCLETLESMIQANRNHPSVIAWSVSNEPFFSDAAVMAKARALTERLVARARELDPSRPAAVGGAQRGGFDRLGDLAGYNGDGAALFRDPGIPNLVSEYGSTVEDRPGHFGHRYTDGVEVRESWRSGVALWCGFHHQSIIQGMGHMGFIDHSRLPLAAWYWYRRDRLGTPVPPDALDKEPTRLELTADRLEIGTDGTDDTRLVVRLVDDDGRTVDRQPDVLLEVLEGDGRFPSGRSIVLSTSAGTMRAGLGATDLRAYYSGSIRVRATAAGLSPSEVTIAAIGPVPWDGQELRLLTEAPERNGHAPLIDDANIAGHRPVFADSWLPSSPPSLVTELDDPNGWFASDNDPGHWVRVDLEGPRSIERVAVHVKRLNVPMRVSLSEDGRNFTEIGTFSCDIDDAVVIWERHHTRYIDLSFPDRPTSVVLVEVFESDGLGDREGVGTAGAQP